MPLFKFNDGSLDLPTGWEDRTVVALSFPTGSSKPDASFAITRDRSASEDASLASYVDRQLVDMAKSCPRFELVRRERIALNGENAETMEFTWRSPDGSFVRQRQTIVRLKSGVALAMTGTAPSKRFEEFSDAFQGLVQTFRLRSEE